MKKNTYKVEVFRYNDEFVPFDSGEFTNLKEARHWACGRGGDPITVKIFKNGKPFMVYATR